MRFFHIADVHLGAVPDKGYPWSEDRGREIWDSFRKVIRQAGREHAGLFLIAGDLFHRQPQMKDLKEVNALFSSIPDTKVVIIAGNHDYMKPGSAYQKMDWAENVHWLDSDHMTYVDFPNLQTRVWGFSYHSREICRPLYDGVKADDKVQVNILLAHGGDEKHIPITGQTFAGSDFDYIALGHIHKPQILEENRIAYAGALEPLDKNDPGVHGYIKGECTSKGTSIAFVPCAAREYKNIKIQISEKTTQYALENTLKKVVEEKGKQHIYSILLEGKKSLDTEFLEERLYKTGNIREIQDRTHPAYAVDKLKQRYEGSILEAYMDTFSAENRTKEEEKALHYGIEALLLSGEDLP